MVSAPQSTNCVFLYAISFGYRTLNLSQAALIPYEFSDTALIRPLTAKDHQPVIFAVHWPGWNAKLAWSSDRPQIRSVHLSFHLAENGSKHSMGSRPALHEIQLVSLFPPTLRLLF